MSGGSAAQKAELGGERVAKLTPRRTRQRPGVLGARVRPANVRLGRAQAALGVSS